MADNSERISLAEVIHKLAADHDALDDEGKVKYTAFGLLTGIPPMTIYRAANGDTKSLSSENQHKICERLDVDLDVVNGKRAVEKTVTMRQQQFLDKLNKTNNPTQALLFVEAYVDSLLEKEMQEREKKVAKIKRPRTKQ